MRSSASCIVLTILLSSALTAADGAGPTALAPNLAIAATVTTSYVSGHETLNAVNDGYDPANSEDHDHGAYGNWPSHGTQWVEYTWTRPVNTNGVGVYWWDDHQGVRLPAAARLSYWDGRSFVPIQVNIAVTPDHYNKAEFPVITTTKLRLEIDSQGHDSTGVIEWQVYDAGGSPAFPPTAEAGRDRVVVLPAVTYLHGTGRGIRAVDQTPTQTWSKAAGPGDVSFANAHDPDTTAGFSVPGEYALRFTYAAAGLEGYSTLKVHAEPRPTTANLNAVYAGHYSVTTPFWRDRLDKQIVNWIPHCIAECEDPELVQGGLNNLIDAGKKLRGEPAHPHRGYPFANAWVLNTAEAMSVALTYDPHGDPSVIKAQDDFRKTLDRWIPIILAAQEPDGYFQTRFTLGTSADRAVGVQPRRWDPATRAEHEGYVAGYFIEMGIANYVATDRKERRLFDAAIRLADCWCRHIGPGPGQQEWYDGHQEVEQALVRLGRFVNDEQGLDKGKKYIDLAKFLLDCRGRQGGNAYDQTQAPITQQYEAVGHAVRASYTYSAMADIAMETGDPNYWSGVLSIWDDMVNRKLYVTGGIGSGETSEGFGKDYSLPNNTAYCESCSNCGVLFMQYKLNLATRDAKYADLYETSIYNAILGDVDLPAQNYTYTNSLDSDQPRYKWHDCPCCVGNIPRILLMLPTWTYAKADEGVFVNLFVGSTVDVGKVAGGDLQMVQQTNYPWDGHVAVIVNPAKPARFIVHIRSPQREVSTLYTAAPAADGITSMTVNGQPVDIKLGSDGYVPLDRQWSAGDKIDFVLPMPVQRVIASDKVAATRGRVALQRGPLVYNIESADENVNQPLGLSTELTARWSPDLLGGVESIHGKFADGSPMVAVPNYARLNRGGRSLVWIKQQ